jgi:hypothetical protein
VLAARSPVFMDEFFGGPQKENVATRVSILGTEHVQGSLHFIYTDSLPEIDDRHSTVMA